jgi:hypothetical protein
MASLEIGKVKSVMNSKDKDSPEDAARVREWINRKISAKEWRNENE